MVLTQLLQAHHIRQERERADADATRNEHNLVFTTKQGTPIEPRNLIRHFKKVLEQAGLPAITRFHDLRHSCATLLIAQRVHPRVVMEILGHTNIAITMNTYAHVLPEISRAAAEGLDALFTTDELDDETDKSEDRAEDEDAEECEDTGEQ